MASFVVLCFVLLWLYYIQIWMYVINICTHICTHIYHDRSFHWHCGSRIKSRRMFLKSAKTFSALLALCEDKPSVTTTGFNNKKLVMRKFDADCGSNGYIPVVRDANTPNFASFMGRFKWCSTSTQAKSLMTEEDLTSSYLVCSRLVLRHVQAHS